MRRPTGGKWPGFGETQCVFLIRKCQHVKPIASSEIMLVRGRREVGGEKNPSLHPRGGWRPHPVSLSIFQVSSVKIVNDGLGCISGLK